jgi:anti-sigma B factor antagonist
VQFDSRKTGRLYSSNIQVSTTSSILVGLTNKIVWVRVEGKGSFLNSPGVKDFAKEMINRGHREFVVDLRNCPVMDSTFMGTLAGVALRLRELGQGHLHVINLNERNHALLSNLGLDHLFAIDMPPVKTADEPAGKALDDAPAADRAAQAETMLEAHEALVEASPENLTKFKDVLEYLKQDLHSAE